MKRIIRVNCSYNLSGIFLSARKWVTFWKGKKKGRQQWKWRFVCPRSLFLGHCERAEHYKGKRIICRFLPEFPNVSSQHRTPHYILAALLACVEAIKVFIPSLGTTEQFLTSHCSFPWTTALVLFSAHVLDSLLNICHSIWLNRIVLALNLQCRGGIADVSFKLIRKRKYDTYNVTRISSVLFQALTQAPPEDFLVCCLQ